MAMTKTDLNSFIRSINGSNKKQAEAQFLIANLLHTIKEHELYKIGGFEKFDDMVEAKLTFGKGTAQQYTNLYRHYLRLNYTEPAFIKLLEHFSWRKVNKALQGRKRKVGIKAISDFHAAKDENDEQYNMHITDAESRMRVEQMLGRFGMDASQSGRRNNMTKAFLALLDDYEAITKNQFDDPKQLKLRAVS